MKDIDSLAQTKWRCQYHIVVVSKIVGTIYFTLSSKYYNSTC